MKFKIYKHDKLLAQFSSEEDTLNFIDNNDLIIYTAYSGGPTLRIVEVIHKWENIYKVGIVPTITTDFNGNYNIRYDVGNKHICFTVASDEINDLECQAVIYNRVKEWLYDN